MTKNVLLLGRTEFDLDATSASIEVDGIQLYAGTSLAEAEKVMGEAQIDIVIMGAGLPLESRLQIVERIFQMSKSTTVHLKDWNSGQAGMLPFVNNILKGLST